MWMDLTKLPFLRKREKVAEAVIAALQTPKDREDQIINMVCNRLTATATVVCVHLSIKGIMSGCADMVIMGYVWMKVTSELLKYLELNERFPREIGKEMRS